MLYDVLDIYSNSEIPQVQSGGISKNIRTIATRQSVRTAASRLKISQDLCILGRLQFLGIFNTFFKVNYDTTFGPELCKVCQIARGKAEWARLRSVLFGTVSTISS